MNPSHCVFEDKVAAASRSGVWSDSLRAHVAGCRVCEDLALATGYLSASSQTSREDDALPGADRIWYRAQVAARAAAMERALRPIIWARRFAFGTCAATLIAALFAWRLQLGSIVGGVLESLSHPSAPSPAAQGNSLLLLMAAFLLLLVPLVLGLYSAWAQD